MSTFTAPTPKSKLSSHMENVIRDSAPKSVKVGTVLPITPNAGYEMEKRGLASKATATEDGKATTTYSLTARGVAVVKALRK